MKRHLQTKLLAVATVAAFGATGIAQAGGPPESNAGAGSTPEQVTAAAGVTKDTSSTERSSTAATDREDLPSSSSASTPAAGTTGTSTGSESSPATTGGTSGTTSAAATSPTSPTGTDTTSGLERSTTDTTASPGSTPAIGTATGGSPGTAMSREGLIRHEGDTYFIKEGRAQKVDNEMKLSEGITAQENGKITLKDGTELTLEEGKMVTLEGKVVDTPAQVSSVVTNPATATTPQE
ncbi:MAG: DUF6799 domain-containing protein [Chthoniobacteraceae bacterium]